MCASIARPRAEVQTQGLRVPLALSRGNSLTQWEQTQHSPQIRGRYTDMKKKPPVFPQRQIRQRHRYVTFVGCSLKISRVWSIMAGCTGQEKEKRTGQTTPGHHLEHLLVETVERAIATRAALSTTGRPIRQETSAVGPVASISILWLP